MTIPEYLKVDIKNLYRAMLKEMATDKDKRLKKFTNIIKIYYPNFYLHDFFLNFHSLYVKYLRK